MGLFKSSDERRIERDIKIRQGIRRIEKAIREQGKFSEEFIRHAQHAKRIGDEQQYKFIRSSLKKTAAIKRMLERQLLTVKNALLIKRQAEASADFAKGMGLMATEIGRLFGETDLVKTQGDWEKAMLQAETMDERMDMFLDSIEEMATDSSEVRADSEVITDDEVDRMIEAEAEAEHRKELDKIAGLRAELDALKQRGEKQK
jgi:hypothetical protein